MIISAEGHDDPKGAFECAVLGKYYDNITPLGAGGQPFQIVYLKKRGLSTGTSAALPIAGFLMLQFAFLLIAAVVFIFNGSVTQNVAAIRISAYVGLAFYLFVPVCIVLFAYIPHENQSQNRIKKQRHHNGGAVSLYTPTRKNGGRVI